MRLAIVNPTGGGLSGGYRKYLRNILPRLAAHPKITAILCISPGTLDIKSLFLPSEKVRFADCRSFAFLPLINLELKCKLGKFDPGVIFIPMERYLRFNGVPVVNMVQNMAPLVGRGPNPLREKLRNRIQRLVALDAVRKADRVIAISGFVYEYLTERWGIPKDKIGIIYHGIDLPEKKMAKAPEVIPGGWKGDFLFTAGAIEPYKGLEDIVLAIAQLRTKGINVRMVIAGKERPAVTGYLHKITQLVEQNHLSSSICFSGDLTEEGMRWCYLNCRVLVMSTRVEACPNVALEAMAHGCICISADNPPLPEIFGNTAIYYPSKDVDALSTAIQEAFYLDPRQREKTTKAAQERSLSFSWDICVERTVAEILKAYKNTETSQKGISGEW